ncbi:MAG: D-alanyl-D-alanine carboxypeptidase/D-alanyl-D-alanine-endopeptidase, partial [Woeseiales bacterium]
MNSRTTISIALVLSLLVAVIPSTAVSDEVLPLSIQSALKIRNVPDQALSIYVEDLATGEVILAWNDAIARNPASVEKMVTTLVALDTLGPAYRWKTEVSFLGDIQDGVLDGDIALKGYGDPYLVTERFWQLLRDIRAAGINSISGDVLIDDSYFAVGDYDPAAFDREPLRAYNVSPNALLTNFKVVRHFFEPANDGTGIRVRMDPDLQNLDIVNRLRIANGSCRGYQRGITITPNEDVSRITFSGRFPSGCEIYSMTRAALSHNEFTYGLFRSLWEESGGVLSGAWRNVFL